MKKIIIGTLIVIVVMGALYLFSNINHKDEQIFVETDMIVKTFEDCVNEGNDILYAPYIYESFPHQCIDKNGEVFVEGLERDIKREETEWNRCNVPDSFIQGIDSFDCPAWMGDISWDSEYKDDHTIKFSFYNSIDEERQRAYLSKESGIAFMIENIVEKNSGEYSGFNSIKFIYPNHRIVTLYQNNINIYHESFDELKFSPDGKYITFKLSVYDGQRISIIDVNTGNDIILPEYDIYSYSIDQIIWSSDSRYIIIDNDFSGYGADGSESVFVADLNKGNRFTEIFSVDSDKVWFKTITDLSFDETNKEIYFVERGSSGIIRYKYNILSEELAILD